MDLKTKKCIPCEGGIDPFNKDKIEQYLSYLQNNWEVIENKKIKHTFNFNSFIESIDFVNKVAKLSEEEGHHPNICIDYKFVEVVLWTHAIDGLSENDFILATKIELLK